MITRPERDPVSTGADSAGPVVVFLASDLVFGITFLLLLGGNVFATLCCVSAGGIRLVEGDVSGTSEIADGGMGTFSILSSSGKPVGYLTGTCGWGRCYGGVTWFDVMFVASEPSVALIINDPV